jgi:hypothetical protein
MALYVIENHGNVLISDETFHCLSRAYARLGKQIRHAFITIG